jgi:hypothetical protein
LSALLNRVGDPSASFTADNKRNSFAQDARRLTYIWFCFLWFCFLLRSPFFGRIILDDHPNKVIRNERGELLAELEHTRASLRALGAPVSEATINGLVTYLYARRAEAIELRIMPGARAVPLKPPMAIES